MRILTRRFSIARASASRAAEQGDPNAMSATDQRARSYSLSIASRLHRSSLYKTAKHKQRDSVSSAATMLYVAQIASSNIVVILFQKQDDSEHGLTDTQVEGRSTLGAKSAKLIIIVTSHCTLSSISRGVRSV